MSLELANQILPNLKKGNRNKVVSIIHDLITMNASLNKTWGSIARVATSIGEVKLASKAAELYSLIDTSNIQLLLSRAGILAELGHTHDAIELIEPLMKDNSDVYSLHHFLGIAKSQVGDIDSAEKHLRSALKTKKNLGHTWLALATIIKFTANDDDIRAMESVIKSGKFVDRISEAALYFALGKAYMDSNQHTEALKKFEKASQNMNKISSYNAKKDRSYVDDLISSYSEDNLKNIEQSQSNYSPIIILGLPRSGTTLVAQILASHSDTIGMGEINLFGQGMMSCNGYLLENINDRQKELQEESVLMEIGETYQRLCSERFCKPGRVVDKSFSNIRHLGAISKVFPKAKFVWVSRDVEETAWSCYRTFFSQQMNWTWDLKDIATYFTLEEKVMKHWLSLFGDRILKLSYQDFVTEPDIWTKNLLKHCDLDYNSKVLEFYKNNNPVQTASVAQVRNPIYDTALGINHHYAEFIQPFRDSYYE